MQTQRITGFHTVLDINAITKLYYIFQLHTFLTCKNMANTKTEDPCIITNSAWIQCEKKERCGYIQTNKIKIHHITH